MNPEKLIKEYENKTNFVEFNKDNFESEIIIQNNKELKSYIKNNSNGISVRMLVNGCFGFSSSNNEKDIEKVFKTSYKLALNGSRVKKTKTIMKELPIVNDYVKSGIKQSPFEISNEEKIKYLKEFNKTYSLKQIKNIETMFSFSQGKSILMNSLGTRLIQENNHSQLFSTIIGGQSLEKAYFMRRSLKGFEFFKYDYNKDIQNVQEKLKRLINAKSPKLGKYDIVIDPVLAGTFFHEAVGHALEADNLREKSTCLSMNEQVTKADLTLIDNPSLPYYWGSYAYDDEGIKSKPSTIIKNGKIVNFINDISSYFDVNGLEKTSNGRRSSIHDVPIPRMSNLVVKEGDLSKQELFKKVNNGLLVTGFQGGAVEPITGVFSFKADEAFVIKNGELRESLKGVSLSGDLKQVLQNITGIGNKVEDLWIGGMCGKKGQSVPVSEKVPYISVRGVSVGN